MLGLKEQIIKQLEKSQNILILSPKQEGGTTASALALFLFLKNLGKKVEIVKPQSDSKKLLNFLPGYSEIKNNLNNLRQFIVSLDIHQAKISQIKYTIDKDILNFIISPSQGWFEPKNVKTKIGKFKYDLIITIGIKDLESLSKIYDNNVEFFYKTPLINIDYQATNEDFGQINFVDLNTISNSEILFNFFKKYQSQFINEDIATCLLADIIQETKNFKTKNLTPQALLITSQLIALGARREEIVNHLYRSHDIFALKLWGRILNNLKTNKESSVLWSKLRMSDFHETKTTTNDLRGVIDELIINVPQTKVIVIFYEQTSERTKLLLYALKNIDAFKLLKEYSPQGTNKVIEISFKQNLEKTIEKIIPKIKNELDKLNL